MWPTRVRLRQPQGGEPQRTWSGFKVSAGCDSLRRTRWALTNVARRSGHPSSEASLVTASMARARCRASGRWRALATTEASTSRTAGADWSANQVKSASASVGAKEVNSSGGGPRPRLLRPRRWGLRPYAVLYLSWPWLRVLPAGALQPWQLPLPDAVLPQRAPTPCGLPPGTGRPRLRRLARLHDFSGPRPQSPLPFPRLGVTASSAPTQFSGAMVQALSFQCLLPAVSGESPLVSRNYVRREELLRIL